MCKCDLCIYNYADVTCANKDIAGVTCKDITCADVTCADIT